MAMAMAMAMNDDNTPVLVGCGQITQRQPDPRAALAPLALMAQAARLAADNSGAGNALLQVLDTVAVIRLFADASPRFACPFGRCTNRAELDQVPHPRFLALADGPASVETWTVMHDAKGPIGAIVIGRLADGARFLANTPVDAALLADMQARDQIGRAGRVRNGGLRNTFTPS